MSEHRYISNSSVLFEDYDVDVETSVPSPVQFQSRIPPPQSKLTTPIYDDHTGELERQRQMILQKQRTVEQETLDSSKRSLALLCETTQIGIATSAELVHQGKQLKNTNRYLDEINMNLKDSQKHLNGMKSVFYGIKNYVSGKSDQTLPRSQVSPGTHGTDQAGTSNRLEESRSNTPSFSAEDRYNSHPSTRLRGLDMPATAAPISDSQQVNTILDAHLDEMMQHITTLKDIGTAMGKEINEQNQLIDILQDKVEVADIKIDKQNKQIIKFLGK